MMPRNGRPDTRPGPDPVGTITADDLATAWPRAAVVDVRSAEEFAIAYIPGSLNVPLDELPFRLSGLPNTTVHLLCGSGKRSSQAARFLSERGYSTVNVAGGITEWYRGGHPVTHAPPSKGLTTPRRRPLGPHLLDLLRRRPAGKS